jgi:hypothetical protein
MERADDRHQRLKAANATRWASAKITRDATVPARRVVAAKPRYRAVVARTGVPWFAIAVIHEREVAQRWDTQLGQGDPLNCVSVHVPAGRGPFANWEDGAYDALVNCAPHAAPGASLEPGSRSAAGPLSFLAGVAGGRSAPTLRHHGSQFEPGPPDVRSLDTGPPSARLCNGPPDLMSRFGLSCGE